MDFEVIIDGYQVCGCDCKKFSGPAEFANHLSATFCPDMEGGKKRLILKSIWEMHYLIENGVHYKTRFIHP